MSGYSREPGEQDIDKVLKDTLGSPQRPYPSLAPKVFDRIQNPVLAQVVRQERQQKQRRQDWELLKALALRSLQAFFKASVHSVKAKIRRAKARRRQAEKSGNRGIASIPVIGFPVVVLFVLVALVIIALAYSLSHGSLPPFKQSGGQIPVQQGTITLPRQPGETPTVVPTRPAVTPSGSPTASGPTIMLCITPQDKAQNRIRVCGSNFTPGDKVSLYIYPIGGGQIKIRHWVTVDGQGNFVDLWTINNCKDVPRAIYAQDVSPSHKAEVSPLLQIIQFSSCPAQSPVK